jgi:hypothetical protein
MTHVGDFVRSIDDSTADNGAAMMVWQLVIRLEGRAVVDLTDAPSGWRLRIEPHNQSRYVVLVAEGERPI